MHLETARLTIRPWSHDEADRLLDIQSRIEVVKWLGDGEPVLMKDLDEAHTRIDRYQRAQRDAAARLLGRRGARDRGGRRLRHPADASERRRRRGRGRLAPAPRLVGPRLRHRGRDRRDPARLRRRACPRSTPSPTRRTSRRRPCAVASVSTTSASWRSGTRRSRASTARRRSAGPTAPEYAVRCRQRAQPPTCTCGRRSASGSARRMISWVSGGMSPSPASRKRSTFWPGAFSLHSK